MPILRRTRPFLLLLLLGAAAACGRPLAQGEPNSILVVTPESVWAEIEDETRAALEPRAFTVRDERIFNVTHVAPDDERFARLQVLRQVLVIGEPGDPWVQAVLDEADGEVPRPPAIVEANDVWAQGQGVTLLLMPPGYDAEAVERLLPQVGEAYLADYERYARERMFVTGPDTAIAAALRRDAGFALRVPAVYRMRRPEPDVVIFRNDNPDPATLLREVLVTWRPSTEQALTPAAALQWRSAVQQQFVQPPQQTDPEIVDARRLQVGEQSILQIQGLWSNPPDEWPAAGPFLTWMVECPAQDRTYLIDTWLYAPGRAKYEYLVQLQTILQSFRCGA